MFKLKKFLGLEYYTSELDQFLKQYDHTHPTLSASQHKEAEKHKRIALLRDQPTTITQEVTFWDKF